MHKPYLKILCAFICLACSLSASRAYAVTIDGIEVPDTIRLEGSGKKLLLNGAGIRSKFFFSIYIGALYLPTPRHTTESIMQADDPNRVMMYCLYKSIEKPKLTAAWNEGFDANLDSKQLAALKSRIDQFNELFPALKRGDIVLLNYLPDKGTSLVYNGKLLGNIQGHDFNRALLRIWLGKHPADDSLKTDMLGKH